MLVRLILDKPAPAESTVDTLPRPGPLLDKPCGFVIHAFVGARPSDEQNAMVENAFRKLSDGVFLGTAPTVKAAKNNCFAKFLALLASISSSVL